MAAWLRSSTLVKHIPLHNTFLKVSSYSHTTCKSLSYRKNTHLILIYSITLYHLNCFYKTVMRWTRKTLQISHRYLLLRQITLWNQFEIFQISLLKVSHGWTGLSPSKHYLHQCHRRTNTSYVIYHLYHIKCLKPKILISVHFSCHSLFSLLVSQ